MTRETMRRDVTALCVAYGLTLVVLGVALAASRALDRGFWMFTQEPAGVLEAPSYVGFLSNTTQLAGIAGCVASLLVWCVLGFGVRSPWLWGGILVGALTANDMFLLDDYLVGVGIPEPVTSSALGLGALLFVGVYWSVVRTHGVWLVAAALAGFFGAELLDRVSQDLDSVEDVLRFVSQVSWGFFFVRAAVVELAERGAGAAASPVVDRTRSRSVVAAVYGAAALTIVAVVAASRVLDRDVSFLTREPVDALDADAYIGTLSNLGALVWAAAVTAALIGWLVTRRAPLLFGGLLSLLLLADDFYRLHETYYPQVGIPQKVANAAYFTLALAYLVVFRRYLRRHGGWLLVVALGLLGASAALDAAFRDQDAIEDSVKLLGIVTWATWFVVVSYEELRDHVSNVDSEYALAAPAPACG